VLTDLRELYKFRELLIILVLRDLKVRYKNSYLGILWSLVNPIIQVAVITIVIQQFLRGGVPNYSAYVFAAFLPFMFFQACLLDSTHSIAMHDRMLRMVYFPREVIPLSIVISNVIHFVLAIGIFLAYRLLTPLVWHFRFEWTIPGTIVYLPALILVHALLVTGLALWLSALNVFYEDVRYLLTVGLQVLYFFVPVIYFAEHVAYSGSNLRSHGLIYKLYMLNPLAVFVTAFRKAMVPPFPPILDNPSLKHGSLPLDPGYMVWATCAAIGIAFFGYSFFNRKKWQFVERP
jgi:homopolymeric O-antigen transport system permease protein